SLGKGRLGPCQELPWIPGDEARPALKSHVGPHPREHYEYTVTKSDEEKEVHGHPREPGGEPGELEPPKIRHSRSTPDGCQGALVLVVKWCVGLVCQGAPDAVRRMAPTLNSRGRDTRYGFAVGHGCRQVPDDKYLGMSRDGQIVLHLDAAGPVKRSSQTAR